MNFDTLSSMFISMLPKDIDTDRLLQQLEGYIPKDMDFVTMAKSLGVFCAGFLLLSVLGRICMGKRSSLNGALSSAMGIVFIYGVTVVVYTLLPGSQDRVHSPLPFVTFGGEYLVLLPFLGGALPYLCQQILGLIILAFLMNLIDSFLPRGSSVIRWYLLRFLSVGLGMGLYILVRLAFDTYLPSVLVSYAPMILLGVLVVFLLLGVIKLALGMVLTVVNPLLGAAYAFFFANAIGKQLTKSMVTGFLLTLCVFALEKLGYVVILLSGSLLIACIPLVLVALILWYIIGHVL